MFDIVYISQIIKIKLKVLNKLYTTFMSSDVQQIDKKGKYAFIICSADYNNLGDIAITFAQEQFLRRTLEKDYTIIKIPSSKVYSWIMMIRKLSTDGVLITLVGGGNNGSLYEFIEEPRRFVLLLLRNYKIVSFPQTVLYERTSHALPYEHEFRKICMKCSNLTLVAREKMSFSYYQSIEGVNTLLAPDIVFSLTLDSSKSERVGVAFILRDDKEKEMNENIQKKLIDISKTKFKEVYFWDTCDVKYKEDNSRELVDNYLAKLRTVKVAITDRLHGMIMCYISGTPCIVIDNNNGKIKATFETWLNNQNYIRMYDPSDGLDKFQGILNDLNNLLVIQQEDLSMKFDELREMIK